MISETYTIIKVNTCIIMCVTYTPVVSWGLTVRFSRCSWIPSLISPEGKQTAGECLQREHHKNQLTHWKQPYRDAW